MSKCISDDDTVFTLEDLKHWSRKEPSLAVLGHPVSHSISPQIHNAALAELSKSNDLFKKWKYFKFDIIPEDLKLALSLFFQKNFIGLNLTIPHKFIACNLIKNISKEAKIIGATNTLVKESSGYTGHNTDGYGLEQAIKFDLGGRLVDSNIILIGAGGAARAAASQCLNSQCKSLWIGNRNQDRLSNLIKDLKSFYSSSEITGFSIKENLPENLPKEGILINATSLGLKSEDPSPVNLKSLSRELMVFDMIYKSGESQLIKDAKFLGQKCTDGLSMLVWQGEKALEIWTKTKSPVEVMKRHAKSLLKSV